VKTKADRIKGYFRGTFSRIIAKGMAINPEAKKFTELKRAMFSLEKPVAAKYRFKSKVVMAPLVLVINRKPSKSLQFLWMAFNLPQ
jgi:hypothetical protein